MAMLDPSMHMWVTFAVIALAVAFYATEVVSLELTSLGVLTALTLLFSLFPLSDGAGGVRLDARDLLSGFAEPALIAILALLVVGQAMIQTGALEGPANRLVDMTRQAPGRVIPITLALVLLISGVLNNTPIVVIFVPIMSVLARKLNLSESRLMIPLSYAAILGGNLTLIGSSTNLLAAGAFTQITGERIGFFQVTVMGAALGAVGFAYLHFLLPRLLTERFADPDEAPVTGRQFIVQVEVSKGGILEGMQAVAGLFPGLPNITVRSILRDGHMLLPPFDDLTLKAGDQLMIAATRRALTDLMKRSPQLMRSARQESGAAGAGPDRLLAEVVIAPASRMAGRTLDQIGFTAQTGCTVVGIQRRSRMIRQHLNEIRLEAGDTLLVVGTPSDVRRLRANRDVLLLEWSASDLPLSERSLIAILIFLAVVISAATEILSIPVAALTGATLLLATGCINVRQAARAIDRRIILIVAAALAMGQALQGTGGASFLTQLMLSGLEGAAPWLVVSGFFLLIAVMTNLLSNYTTAVLFTPIALNLARTLDVEPILFLLAVIYAANCSFATPIGYQTNLLVMGPGHYRFVDFIKAGAPLIVLMWLAFTLFAGLYLLF
ncbi:MAG: SLC13 family permease [Rhodothalassiaceae bacterium]